MKIDQNKLAKTIKQALVIKENFEHREEEELKDAARRASDAERCLVQNFMALMESPGGDDASTAAAIGELETKAPETLQQWLQGDDLGIGSTMLIPQKELSQLRDTKNSGIKIYPQKSHIGPNDSIKVFWDYSGGGEDEEESVEVDIDL